VCHLITVGFIRVALAVASQILTSTTRTSEVEFESVLAIAASYNLSGGISVDYNGGQKNVLMNSLSLNFENRTQPHVNATILFSVRFRGSRILSRLIVRSQPQFPAQAHAKVDHPR